MTNVTFKEQAKWFLQEAVSRKRNPVKPATHSSWTYSLNKWLIPHFVDAQLATVTNSTVRGLVEKFYRHGLSAQTITTYVNLVKLVVASAIDENGEQVFPRKWNSTYLDMPLIRNQRQPSFAPETVSAIVGKSEGQLKVLFALLAGTGLRIGEALGLETKHVSPDCRTISVEQAAWCGKIQPPKTASAHRKVDLSPELATMLRDHLGPMRGGLVFPNACGRPLSQTNLLKRNLHPILKQLGCGKQGFHGTRRFRVTWLRKQQTPADILAYWMGHSSNNITDRYSKLYEDNSYRQEVSEKVGLGFSVSC